MLQNKGTRESSYNSSLSETVSDQTFRAFLFKAAAAQPNDNVNTSQLLWKPVSSSSSGVEKLKTQFELIFNPKRVEGLEGGGLSVDIHHSPG